MQSWTINKIQIKRYSIITSENNTKSNAIPNLPLIPVLNDLDSRFTNLQDCPSHARDTRTKQKMNGFDQIRCRLRTTALREAVAAYNGYSSGDYRLDVGTTYQPDIRRKADIVYTAARRRNDVVRLTGYLVFASCLFIEEISIESISWLTMI